MAGTTQASFSKNIVWNRLTDRNQRRGFYPFSTFLSSRDASEAMRVNRVQSTAMADDHSHGHICRQAPRAPPSSVCRHYSRKNRAAIERFNGGPKVGREAYVFESTVIADELSGGGRAAMDEDLQLLQRQIVERKQAPGADTSSSGRMVAIPRRRDSEIDGAVGFYVERLREVRKRHCRGLLAAVEREAARRLRGKEAELEEARMRSAALEEKVRQLSAEGQMWVAAARHHEAAVGVLRASMERTLRLQQSSGAGHGREGYGDSEAASAESSCRFAVEEKGRRGRLLRRSGWCMACGLREARALLLPCKHLCLCEDCERGAGECPVCGAIKTFGVQVFTC